MWNVNSFSVHLWMSANQWIYFRSWCLYLHCTWLLSQGDELRRQKQMAVPTMQAEMMRRLLTATKTNHVNSKPSSVPLSWPGNYCMRGIESHLRLSLGLYSVHLLRHIVFVSSSDPSPQWLTLSQTKSGLIHSSFVMHRNSLHVCSGFTQSKEY